VREIGKNPRNQSNMASIKEYSDSDRVLVCASQAEMLEKFEEYKIKTNTGWRCIKSNALFGT
jgi:hypothetical protein